MSELESWVSNPCIRLQTCSIKGTNGDQEVQMHLVQNGELISPPIFWLFFCFDLAIWHIEKVSWGEVVFFPLTKGKFADTAYSDRFMLSPVPGKLFCLWRAARLENSERSLIQGITEILKEKMNVFALSVQHKWSNKKGISTPGLGQTIWDKFQFCWQREQQWRSRKEGEFRVAGARSCWESLELSG